MSDPALPQDPNALKKLLRERADQPPENTFVDNGPWDFLSRVPDDARENFVRPVVHELLTDGDPTVRERALGALMNFPTEASTIDRLIEVASRRAQLFADQTVNGRRLREKLEHALANVAYGSPREREIAALLRALAGSRVPVEPAATILGKLEPDFAADVVRRHGAAAAQFAVEAAVMVARFHRDELTTWLASAKSLPQDAREQLASRLQPELALDDARLAALAARANLPPPAQPAPSLDQCRKILGL